MAWFHSEPIKTPLKGSEPTMVAWMREWFRYTVHSPSKGRWSKVLTDKTVKSILKRGFLDSEVYVFVNNVRGITVDRRTVLSAQNPTNWVMDLDNPLDIKGKTTEERIDSLYKKIKKLKIPEPALIIETSPGSFHLVYRGKQGDWTKERRIALCLKMAGAKRAPQTQPELTMVLKSGGIDLAYLVQGIGLAKFRLPGSINYKKSVQGKDLGKINKCVVVGGWINENWTYPTQEALETLDVMVPLTVKETIDREKTKRFSKVKPEIQRALSGYISTPLVEGVSEFLCNNINFLQKNNCRILQDYLADFLGVCQPLVSRLISELKSLGYLIQVRDYERHKRAKTYGTGPMLQMCIERAMFNGRVYDFTEPYVDGSRNTHFLRDIRAAVKVGMTETQLIDIIARKQVCRPVEKHMSPKDIARAYRLWLNRIWSPEEASG